MYWNSEMKINKQTNKHRMEFPMSSFVTGEKKLRFI